jgi:hypothetical protein
MTLRRSPLKIWVFVASITNELVYEMNILHVDLWRQTLRLAEEDILLWSPGQGPGLPAW